MKIPSIRTKRLLLRPWRAEDAEALVRILQEEGILRYFPNPNAPTREKVDAYIAHQLDHWGQRGYGHWAITMPEDHQIIGWNGLEYLPELEQTEVTYLLSKGSWGRGFASEAAQEAIRFGFEQAGLAEIIGLTHPDNVASISVLEKCGLRLADRIELWGMEMLRYRIHRPD